MYRLTATARVILRSLLACSKYLVTCVFDDENTFEVAVEVKQKVPIPFHSVLLLLSFLWNGSSEHCNCLPTKRKKHSLNAEVLPMLQFIDAIRIPKRYIIYCALIHLRFNLGLAWVSEPCASYSSCFAFFQFFFSIMFLVSLKTVIRNRVFIHQEEEQI